MTSVAVVGIGNPYRGDDGAGWAAIDALAGKLPDGVRHLKLRGDIAQLVELFAEVKTVFLIDACSNGKAPGWWQRIDVRQEPLPPDQSMASTHGLSLKEALALAETLDQLPAKVIVYAISAREFADGEELSGPVATAVREVTGEILREEEITCMKRA